jgi:hypothetical protein
MTAIAASQAVRHRTRKDLLPGRVHHVIGERAVVTWVRRLNKSVVRVENLEPIADAELVAAFHLAEADPEGYGPTREESRRFLLGAAAAHRNGCS